MYHKRRDGLERPRGRKQALDTFSNNIGSLRYGWVAAFLIALLLTPGFNSFETPEADVLERLLTTGQIALNTQPHDLFLKGHDGRYYPSHEPGANLAALPIAAAALASVRLMPQLPFSVIFELLCSFAAAAVFATTVVLCVRLCSQLGTPLRFAWPRVFVLLLGSQYLVYGLHLADVSLSAPCFVYLLVLLAAVNEERSVQVGRYAMIGLLCAALVLLKLTNAAIAAGVALFLGLHLAHAGKPLLRAAAGMAAGALPLLLVNGWWNWFRSGSPLHAIYEDWQHGFKWHYFAEGFAGTILSPGKGLVVYTPFLLVSAALLFRLTGTGAILARITAGTLLFAVLRLAGTWAWSSFGGWGIRYYVPWIPALAALTVAAGWPVRGSSVRRDRVLAALVIAGVVINGAGTLTNYAYRQELCGLIYPWTASNANVCAIRALPANIARTAGAGAPEIVVPKASADNVFISNRLNVWWYSARRKGVPGYVSWLMGMALAAGAAWAWRRQTAFLRSGGPGTAI